MKYIAQTFNELNVNELYQILKARETVFNIEQRCNDQDIDDFDQQSLHIRILDNNSLIAYCRITPPGLRFKEPAIGRVLTLFKYRKQGFARKLMLSAINTCEQNYENQDIMLAAQIYLESFYKSLGFKSEGNIYNEAGIAHINMRLKYLNLTS